MSLWLKSKAAASSPVWTRFPISLPPSVNWRLHLWSTLAGSSVGDGFRALKVCRFRLTGQESLIAHIISDFKENVHGVEWIRCFYIFKHTHIYLSVFGRTESCFSWAVTQKWNIDLTFKLSLLVPCTQYVRWPTHTSHIVLRVCVCVSVIRWYLIPRVLRDVSVVDLSVSVLGQKLSMPLCVGSTAMQRMAHPAGETATARG